MIGFILIASSFFCGIRYAQIGAHIDDKAFILNIRGLEILAVNEQLDLADSKSISEARKDYNFHTLVFVGCSGELGDIKFMDQKKLSNFYKGIGVAIQKSDLGASNVTESCIQNVIKEYNEYEQRNEGTDPEISPRKSVTSQ